MVLVCSGLLAFGGWMLSIEERYGAHNHIYFDSNSGDSIIMIDPQTKLTIAKGIIAQKTLQQVFIQPKTDTIELSDWMEQQAGYMVPVEFNFKTNPQ